MATAAVQGRISSLFDFYVTVMKIAIQEQIQYRAANYAYMLGMVAEPVIYLVVWSTIAEARGGTLQGFSSADFAAYYIVWTLVRNMNIVFTPYGWEWRIREGRLSGMLLRPLHPIHYDLAYFAGWHLVVIVMWVPLAVFLSLVFRPELSITPLEAITFFLRPVGGLSHPFDVPVGPGDGHLLDHQGRRPLRDLFHRRAASLGPAGAAGPHALVGADACGCSPFQVDVRVSDRGARGGHVTRPTAVRPRYAGAVDGGRGRARGARLAGRHQTVHGGEQLMGAQPQGTEPVGHRDPLRPLKLAWIFLRIGIMNEVQYRVNFFIQLFQAAVALGTALAVLALVFSHTRELAGWSPPELLAVMGIHVMVGGIVHALIQPNMEMLIEDVREGKLDYILTKPEDAQLLVSIRQVRLWQGVDVLVGATVLVVAVLQLSRPVGVLHAALFALALMLGIVMVYCFWMILAVGAFWLVRLEFIVELFEGVYQAGRWPVGIYPFGLRVILTFLVPLAFAITVPAEAVTARLDAQTMLAATVFAAALFSFTRWAWKRGLKRYSGASA